jgi:ssRNA-specific RNase YbeY (16S rRNA maturation enzyme)
MPVAAAAAAYRVDLRVGKLDCSAAAEESVRVALNEASSLLARRCGLRLRWRGFEKIKTNPAWCRLPADRKKRIQAVQAFTLPFRRGKRSREISVFLVDQTSNHRLAWAHYNRDKHSGCGNPHNPAHFPFLGSIFLTNDALLAAFAADAENEKGGSSRRSMLSLLLVHELAHALTQQGHPTRQKAGNILADATSDIGENITPDQCACMLQSPWVHPVP